MLVSAKHKMDKWQLDNVTFANTNKGEWSEYRVGYDRGYDQWYASAPNFGCGKMYDSPAKAIHGLLWDNGCFDIEIRD